MTELELDVGAVAHGGFCVARHQGRVVFVRHALPGERVLAVVTDSSHDSYWRADAVRVLHPSPDRVPAACPVAGPGGCGGCDWQHVSPQRQLALKADVVREQLRRIAKLDDVDVMVEPLPGEPLGWRSRVQLAVGPDGRAGLRAHREERVVPIEDCPITVPGVLPPVLAKRWTPGTTVEVTKDDDAAVHVTELAGSGHARHTRTHAKLPRERPAMGIRRRGTPERAVSDDEAGAVAQEDADAVTGGDAVVRRAVGRMWRLPAGAFWQVHPAAAETFAGAVRDFAGAPRGGLAWDLYGGAGLFAAVLAGQVGPHGGVVVVESSRAAVDGAANLRDLPNVQWVAGRVERELSKLPGRPDVVVLDPPRRGAGRVVAQTVASRTPARIVHVACDPAALARDVAVYAEHGYRLAALRAFDAFPMTHHVECIALLRP